MLPEPGAVLVRPRLTAGSEAGTHLRIGEVEASGGGQHPPVNPVRAGVRESREPFRDLEDLVQRHGRDGVSPETSVRLQTEPVAWIQSGTARRGLVGV